jgi:DNA-binding NarL/FixJ family response regulator
MNKAFRIYISDPHAIFREGLKKVVSGIPGLIIAGESDQIDGLMGSVKKTQADLLLLYTIPFKLSIETAGLILKEIPELKIVLLTNYMRHPDLRTADNISIAGIMHKAISEKELLIAFEEIKNGFSYYSQELLPYLNKRRIKESVDLNHNKKEEWSEKEITILKYICKGYNNSEISELLKLKCRSIEGHKSRMIEKAGVPNTINLVLYALKNKLVNISDF